MSHLVYLGFSTMLSLNFCVWTDSFNAGVFVFGLFLMADMLLEKGGRWRK